jgi:glycosyltransferase involved in cell wall biosynthesis
MKRILIFSLAYYPSHVSGAEAAVKEITERISPDDIAFDMVTLRFDKKLPLVEMIGNVRVHRVAGSGYISKILFPFLAAVSAYRLHRKNHYDALWALMTYMLLPVAIVRLMGVRVPHILTLQDGDPYEKVFGRARIKPFIPLIDYGFRTARMVQAISTYLASWPAKRGYRGPVEMIYNGANPKDINESFDPAAVEALKQKLGKKEGDVYLVNTARLEYQKAQDDVIRALPILPSNVKFLIVGGGSDEAMLKDLVKELKLEDRVIFTGQVTRDEVTLYRKAGDIFAAPSRSEGLGNAFLSALASRLPVIATQEGGLAEFIFDEKHNPNKPKTAWVVEKDSPEQIAAAVKDILANPEKVRQVGETGRAMVLEKFNWDSIAKQMRERVFAPVLEK